MKMVEILLELASNPISHLLMKMNRRRRSGRRRTRATNKITNISGRVTHRRGRMRPDSIRHSTAARIGQIERISGMMTGQRGERHRLLKRPTARRRNRCGGRIEYGSGRCTRATTR